MSAHTTDHSSSVLGTHNKRTATNSAPHLLPHLKPNMTILDIGCGPGSISVDLARRVPQGHVTGIEYVSAPLEEAQRLAAREGVTNIDFRVSDIHSLDFPDNSFDVVHVHQVLQHVADPVLALREMRRVAKADGGIVAARESARYVWYPENAGIEAWWELTDKMSRAKGCNACSGRFIHVWAKEAGFDQGRIQKSAGAWCFSNPEERAYWGESMEARAKSSGLSKMAVDRGLASQEELDGMAQGWRRFVEDDDGWFSVLHAEIICWK